MTPEQSADALEAYKVGCQKLTMLLYVMLRRAGGKATLPFSEVLTLPVGWSEQTIRVGFVKNGVTTFELLPPPCAE
jgi:hypothetical protein